MVPHPFLFIKEGFSGRVYNSLSFTPAPRAGRGGSGEDHRKDGGTMNLAGQAKFYLTLGGRRALYVLLRKRNGPRRVALASFPRSGSTWVRHLLEKATGEECGSIYNDRIMPRGAEGVAVKTHGLDSHLFTHALHLVRNPLDAVESYFEWTRERKKSSPPEWEKFVTENISYWCIHTRHWLGSPGRLFTVRYEDLLGDTPGTLEAVCRWLGHDLPGERINEAVEASRIDKMRRINPDRGRTFFRRGTAGASRACYSPEQIRRIEAKAGPLLRKLRYPSLLDEGSRPTAP